MLVAFLYMLGGIPLQVLAGEPGLLASQLLFLALPAIVFCLSRGYDVRRTLSIERPSWRSVIGGTLVMAGGVVIAWFLAWVQSLWTPVPTEYMQAMVDFVTADSVTRLLWLLLLVAAVPAIAEELVFRGVLLSGLRSRAPAWAAILLTGLVFGLFHLSPVTGFRVLPTAWLGILLAWVVVASGSLPLAILLHFVNNAVIVVLASVPTTHALVADPERVPSITITLAGAILLLMGLRVLGRPNPRTIAQLPSDGWSRG